MRQVFTAVMLLFALLTTTAATSQPASTADEQAIRELIAIYDSGKPIALTEDSIFWSGAYKRPIVRGQSRPEPMPGVADRVSTKVKTTIRRIDVSQSGDMAYEFSDAEVTVQTKGEAGQVRTVSFPASLLRVWKKIKGQWQIAAHFVRPHED